MTVKTLQSIRHLWKQNIVGRKEKKMCNQIETRFKLIFILVSFCLQYISFRRNLMCASFLRCCAIKRDMLENLRLVEIE